jgi:hypothetical protein
MSSGDYTHLKRIRNVLSNQNSSVIKHYPHSFPTYEYSLPPVLSSQNYTDFSGFSIESTVQNTFPKYSCLELSSQKYVLGIPVSCLPVFPFCKNTHQRLNRVPNTFIQKVCTNNSPVRPLTQKKQDVLQCHTGYPFRTNSHGYPLKWPGDNRIKKTFRETWAHP